MNKLYPLLAFGLSFTMTGLLWADQAEDEATIRTAAESYVQAFNAHDAQALGAQWSSQAVYINPLTGDQAVGREAITQEFEKLFSESGDTKLEVTVESVQFVSPSVAVERGAARVLRPDAEPEDSVYTAVHVKQDGKWLLDRVSEEDVPVVRSNYEQLKELEWMIGTWVDEDEGSRVETTCKWTKNQSFMTRAFTVSIADRIDMSGMQIIGWDAKAGNIRSWVFDSDGGFGEATWTKKDNRWVINAAATLPDGRTTSAVNILTVLDNNTFTWQSTGRELDGEILPNVEPVKMVRNVTPANE
jgi:uncharacterized protein (TIGR02246 family)